jgi:hypothetical protein
MACTACRGSLPGVREQFISTKGCKLLHIFQNNGSESPSLPPFRMERELQREMQDTSSGKWRGSQRAELVRVGSRLYLSAFWRLKE